MEFEGVVYKIMPVTRGTSARGEWQRQDVVFDYNDGGQFSRKICVTFFNKESDVAKLREGETFLVSVNIESREYNGRWYTDIRAWRVQPKQQQPPVPMTDAPLPSDIPAEGGSFGGGAAAEVDDDLPHITIVGRPNVGKSSLTNALLGEERNIVTSIAGTTRDSIYTRYNKFGMDFYLVDTAGMRKKGKTMEDLEFYSVMRSIRAIENSDVCILMIDARQGLESQDLNIHNLIVRNRKGCVIVVNKWDLIEKDSNTMKEWTEFLRKKLAPFNDIPIIFTSVLNKQRIFDVLQTAIRVYQSRKRRIPTSELNDYMLPLIENYPPPATKGKYIKIKYVTQLPTPTPQFAFFVNLPQYIKEPYRRFLENKIREQWDFSGVPMQLYFRAK